MEQKRPEEGSERYMVLVDTVRSKVLLRCPCTKLVEAFMELVTSPVAGVRAKVEGI